MVYKRILSGPQRNCVSAGMKAAVMRVFRERGIEAKIVDFRFAELSDGNVVFQLVVGKDDTTNLRL